jgi:hypothetical protein
VVEGGGDRVARADLTAARVTDAGADDALLDEIQRGGEGGPVRRVDRGAGRVIGRRSQDRHGLRGGERQVEADDGVTPPVIEAPVRATERVIGQRIGAVAEERRHRPLGGDIACVGHWRTYDGVEVDLVIERDDGAVVAFEVKTAGRVPGDDFRGLRQRRDVLGDAFVAGVVLYTGERGYTYEDRLHALPIDRLWTAA